MELVPTPETQARLLEGLGRIVASRGAAPLLAGPIEPSDRFFPDAYAASLHGARVVAERLLGYAGLGHLRCTVQFAETLETLDGGSESTIGGSSHQTRSQGAFAWFAGIDGETCRFGLEPRALHAPELLVAALAHEVAHAYRAVYGLVGSEGPDEEQATDVTTVYLGFGILTTNGADRYRTSGEFRGTQTTLIWSRESLGYLPPQAFAFLLGAQAVARDADGSDRRQVRSCLETNQAAAFDAAVSVLGRDRARLLGDLRLDGSSVGTPAPTPERSVEVLEPGGELPDPRLVHRADNRGRKVFRVTGRSYRGRGNAVFLSLALLGFGVWLKSRNLWWLAAGVVAGAVLRPRFGGAKPDICSDSMCLADLAPELTTCPRCGGTIAGAITDPNQRLDHPAGNSESEAR